MAMLKSVTIDGAFLVRPLSQGSEDGKRSWAISFK